MSEVRFAFGANWKDYIQSALDDERIEMAVASLRELLKVQDLSGKSFLDIGCGSGLHSLAACLIGASQVIAFDYDIDSVHASMDLRDRAGISEERWQISQASILDSDYIKNLDQTDIVYAWGVLHHTGDIWTAIRNASSLVKPGGLFCIAIYNEVEGGLLRSSRWRRIKRLYCRSNRIVQSILFTTYFSYRIIRMVIAFHNPLTHIRNYKKKRGMSFKHNMLDWLGGYPYEYASAGVIFEYLTSLGPFQLITLRTTSSLGNNQFTFLHEGYDFTPRVVRPF